MMIVGIVLGLNLLFIAVLAACPRSEKQIAVAYADAGIPILGIDEGRACFCELCPNCVGYIPIGMN